MGYFDPVSVLLDTKIKQFLSWSDRLILGVKASMEIGTMIVMHWNTMYHFWVDLTDTENTDEKTQLRPPHIQTLEPHTVLSFSEQIEHFEDTFIL